MRCQHCPATSGTCRGELPQWAFYCRMAERGIPTDLDHIARMSAGETPEIVLPRPGPAANMPGPLEHPSAAGEALGAFERQLADLDLPATCRARHPGEAVCGCQAKARCSRYAKDVAVGECVACIRAGAADVSG